MALLAAEGFDDNDTSRNTLYQNKPYFNGASCYTYQGKTTTTTRYSTGRATNFSNYEYWGLDFGGSKSEIWCAFAFKRTSSVTTGFHILFTLYDGANPQCGLAMNNSGDIFAFRNTTGTILQGTSGGTAAPTDTWIWLSCYVKIDDTVGRFQVYKNGSVIIDYTGDTKQTSNAYATKWFMDQGVNQTGQKDDLFIMDSTGSSFNGHLLVEHRIIPLLPTADGAVVDWTASSGADYTTIDEVAPSDADYIASNTAAQKSIFTFGDLPASIDNVLAVFLTSRSAKDDTAARSYRDIVRISGTDYNGTTITVSASSQHYCGKLHETNPATTAAWTPTEVNALEAGVELVS